MKKSETPLYNAVKKYVKKNPTRFHMPGHKGRGRGIYKSAPYDVTELDFSDDLLHANGVIKKCEDLFANCYGVKNALMFTTGATGGIFALLFAVKCRTDKLILSKNTHKSVFNAMSVLGIEPCFIEVTYSDGIPNPISVNDVKDAIARYEDAGAILIASPDYFGRVCDCKGIKQVIGDRLLIADGAHGAHFIFCEFSNRVELYSDCAVLSLHKTLPCFTGSAIVTCSNEMLFDVLRARRLFHTSSPQYLAMVSMDYARAYMQKKGRHGYRKLCEKLDKIPFEKLDNYDYTKLVLRGGEELSSRLKSSNIYPECVCGDYVVLILSPSDRKRLKRIYRISKQSTANNTTILDTPKLERKYSFSECASRECEKVSFSEANGRVLAEEVGLYPPGVPQFFRGELITKECKDFMIEHKNSLFGVDYDGVTVLK